MKEIKKRIKRKVEKGLKDLGRTRDQVWNTNLNGDKEAIYRGVKVVDGDELSIWGTIGYTYKRITEVDSLKVIEKFILDEDFNIEPQLTDSYLIMKKKYNNARSKMAELQRQNRVLKRDIGNLNDFLKEERRTQWNYKLW